MSLGKRLQPHLAALLTSPRTRQLLRRLQETKRRLGGQPHRVSVWLGVDDPYSYLLVQLLPRFLVHFDVQLELHWLGHYPVAGAPEPERLARYARADAVRVARQQQLDFPACHKNSMAPEANLVQEVTRLLLSGTTLPVERQLALAGSALAALWHDRKDALAVLEEGLTLPTLAVSTQQLEAEEASLLRSGHYLPGMLHYGGEWYWGIDRLPHLARRLQSLGAARLPHDFPLQEHQPELESDYLIASGEALTTLRRQHLPLAFYFSFRSPYSWLALPRVIALADHYGLKLDIRPVLPMVMRGLPVPRDKRMYILLDAAREAERLGIPFGRVCDPVGAGVERCMALFPAARAAGREREYLLSVARGIWAEGVDVSRDQGLRPLVERAGLDWATLAPALQDESWRTLAERNRTALTALGLWGVPTLHLSSPAGDCAVWGQDRLWALEDALADNLSHIVSPTFTGSDTL